MEELVLAEGLNLFVNPVLQSVIPLGNCRSDGILLAEFFDTNRVSGIFFCKCDNFGVVVSPSHAGAIFEGGLRCCIGVELLELDLRLVLGEIGLSSGTGDYDNLIIFTDLVQGGNHVIFMRYDAKCYIHVRKGEINLLCSLISYREVCKDQVNLTGLKVLNTGSCFGRYVVDLNTEVFAELVTEVYVIALVLTILINISERSLIGKYTDVDLTGFLDLIKSSEACIRSCCIGRLVSCSGAVAASGK